MIKRFFKKKKYTLEEFINKLISKSFNVDEISSIVKKNNINMEYTNPKGETFLHICAKLGTENAVIWLIKKGLNVNKETKEKLTPVFYAINSKNKNILKILVENGANLEHLNNHKRTLLQEAVISVKTEHIDYLLNNTKNLNNCDEHGNNLISDALSNGDISLIEKIAFSRKVDINQINNDGDTILHKEIVLKNNKLALLLLKLGADPTILDKNGKNFLFHAVARGFDNISIIQKAVELGCNINSKSADNKNILMESVSHYLKTPKEDEVQLENHLKMIQELINLQVDINSIDNDKENILFMAIKAGDKELIKLLLLHVGLNLNQQNILGQTALFYLALKGPVFIDMIKLFLSKNIELNIKDNDNKTLLENFIDIILHAQNNKPINEEIEEKVSKTIDYTAFLEILLKDERIKINELNSKGEPYFFDTIIYFNFKLFKLLKNANMNINLTDKNQNNIIFRLLKIDYETSKEEQKLYLNTIQSLISMGISLNQKDKVGETALHKAVLYKNEDTLRLFLDISNDLTMTDNKGRTILHLTVFKNKGVSYYKVIHSYNKELVNVADIYGIRPINYAAFMAEKELVIKMLDDGALVNNDIPKDEKMVKFFEKFHQNVLDLNQDIEKEVDKINLNLLISNMTKEFNIKN